MEVKARGAKWDRERVETLETVVRRREVLERRANMIKMYGD